MKEKEMMKIRIESETGEYITDIELTAEVAANMIKDAIERSEKEGVDLGYKLPLTEKDIIKLIQYSFNTLLSDKIKTVGMGQQKKEDLL